MTALEVFYYTGSIFFILFTVATVVVLYYVIRTVTLIRSAVTNINLIALRVRSSADKFQLGGLNMALGVLKSLFKFKSRE